MHDGNDPPAPAPREVASRLEDELKSCQNVLEHYRALLRKSPRKPKGDD